MKDRKRKIKNPCVVCGKEVRWGIDGCPIVEKGKEFETLLGGLKGMKHYDCNPQKNANK
jgi:hypothetical protein